MRFALALLSLAAAVAGCASRSTPPPVAPTEVEVVMPVPASREPVAAPPVEVAPDPPPVVDPHAAVCEAAAALAVAGDHKLAVDRVEADAAECDEATAALLAESRRLLAAADARAARGIEASRAGRRDEAKREFMAALEIYPRYYWVQRLLADQERADDPAAAEPADDRRAVAATSAADRDRLALDELEGARRAQAAGDAPAALAGIDRAIAAAPAGEPVIAEVVEFARLFGLQLFSAGELVEARDVWSSALRLDEANAVLQDFLAEVEARLAKLDTLQADDR